MKLPPQSRRRVLQEFSEADLGDERRTNRLKRMVEALSRSPQASLPTTFESESEAKAAYRFLGSSAFDFDDLLQEHHERSAARAVSAQRVLVLHDTTTCGFG